MAHKFKACAGCTQKCLLVHGNKNIGSHIDTSFFKIMFGRQFSNFMELPPRVARIVLWSDRETFLEDSQGRRWKVALSSADGNLAFRKGWNSFAMDHDIQVGDFLVFNYIVGSHFTVKIYDSTGCEVNFIEIHQNNREIVLPDRRCDTLVEGTMRKSGTEKCAGSDAETSNRLNKVNGMNTPLMLTENASNLDEDNARSKHKRKAEFGEDLLYMKKLEDGDKQGEDRAHILDLSRCEVFKKTKACGSDGSNKIAVATATCSHHSDSSLKLRDEVGSVKSPMARKVADRVISSDASECKRTETNNYSEYKTKRTPPSDHDSSTSGYLFPTLPENPEQICQILDASANNQVAVSGKEHDLIDDSCQNGSKKSSRPSKSYDKMTKNSEKVSVEMTLDPEVIEKEKSLDIFNKVDDQSSNSSSRPIPSDAAEFQRTKENEKTEAKEKKILSDKDSCTETSGHSTPAHSESPEEKEATVSDKSKTTFNVSKKATKECQTADGSERRDQVEESQKEPGLLEIVPRDGKKMTETSESILVPFTSEYQNDSERCDQVASSLKEPGMLNESVPRDNKKLTESSESIHFPITFDCQNDSDMVIVEKKLVDVTFNPCSEHSQEVGPKKRGEVKVYSRVHTERHTDVRAAPSNASDIESTEKSNYTEVKAANVSPYDKVQPRNLQEDESNIPHISSRGMKRLRTTDGSGNDQDTESQREQGLIDDSCQKAKKKLTDVSGNDQLAVSQKEQVSINDSCHRAKEIFAGMSKSSEAEMTKVLPKECQKTYISDPCSQNNIFRIDGTLLDTPNMLQGLRSFSRENSGALAMAKPERFGPDCKTGGALSVVKLEHFDPDFKTGGALSVVKLERFDPNFKTGGALSLVKQEPFDPDGVATLSSFPPVSCLVAKGRQSFLELPKSMPLPLNTAKGRFKQDRRIVYLQGRDEKMWPVLYIRQLYFNILANGWAAFSMANDIEEGDECTIEVKSRADSICSVHVHVTKTRDVGMGIFEECLQKPLVYF